MEATSSQARASNAYFSTLATSYALIPTVKVHLPLCYSHVLASERGYGLWAAAPDC